MTRRQRHATTPDGEATSPTGPGPRRSPPASSPRPASGWRRCRRPATCCSGSRCGRWRAARRRRAPRPRRRHRRRHARRLQRPHARPRVRRRRVRACTATAPASSPSSRSSRTSACIGRTCRRRGRAAARREPASPHHARAAGAARAALRRRARDAGRRSRDLRARAPRRRRGRERPRRRPDRRRRSSRGSSPSGHDFYAAPRISPDGTRLAWLSWDHPDMPWDGTELWVADLTAAGGLAAERRVAGGPAECVLQPAWSPDGRLHFVSDRSGWWNLYRVDDEAAAAARRDEAASPAATPLAPLDAEFAKPSWVFGLQDYVFLPDGRLLAYWSAGGADRLGVITADPGRRGGQHAARRSPAPSPPLGSIAVAGRRRRGARRQSARRAPPSPCWTRPRRPADVRRASAASQIDPGYISAPEPIEFPTSYEPGSVTGPLVGRAGGGGRVPQRARAVLPAREQGLRRPRRASGRR